MVLDLHIQGQHVFQVDLHAAQEIQGDDDDVALKVLADVRNLDYVLGQAHHAHAGRHLVAGEVDIGCGVPPVAHGQHHRIQAAGIMEQFGLVHLTGHDELVLAALGQPSDAPQLGDGHMGQSRIVHIFLF